MCWDVKYKCSSPRWMNTQTKHPKTSISCARLLEWLMYKMLHVNLNYVLTRLCRQGPSQCPIQQLSIVYPSNPPNPPPHPTPPISNEEGRAMTYWLLKEAACELGCNTHTEWQEEIFKSLIMCFPHAVVRFLRVSSL